MKRSAQSHRTSPGNTARFCAHTAHRRSGGSAGTQLRHKGGERLRPSRIANYNLMIVRQDVLGEDLGDSPGADKPDFHCEFAC
ncbi:hypothetical protein PUN4_280125 [Paraburkholderia unamae]|nr:hypothetical protein PUN4_280125 [Paraburkholderia unamae]